MRQPLRIALVTGGLLPVPAPGWGAVEGLVDSYREHLTNAGHAVDVFNSAWFNETIVALRRRTYDFIHLHHDLYCGAFNQHLDRPFCVTSHYGGFGRFIADKADAEYVILFRDTLQAPGNLVFSHAIRELYVRSGYAGFLRVLENPIDVRRFAFRPNGNGRAICLGRIQPRKQQAMLADAVKERVRVDFVGPHDPVYEPHFRPAGAAQYLGEWDRATVHARLTDYSALVLLSRSEGDALVVKEAIAAGLSVVVTESARGTVAASPFVTVLPNDVEQPSTIAAAVQAAIDGNHRHRSAARDYALHAFDIGVVLESYLRYIEEFAEYHRSG